MRLLLEHLGVRNPERIVGASEPHGRPIDWDRVITTASRHGVVPLFARSFLKHGEMRAVAKVTERLRRETRLISRRNFVFAQELLRLMELFWKDGIGAVPYKGALLAATAYGDVSLRQFSDLDILVKPQDLFRAKELLAREGYHERFVHGHRPLATLTETQRQQFLHYNHEYEVERKDGLLIDLHWRLAPNVYPAQLDPEPMWRRLQPFRMEGREVKSFCIEDQILVLCMHGSKDEWRKMIWIVDLQKTVVNNSDIDWNIVFERARQARIRPQVLLGLGLIRELFEVPLTPEVSERLDANAKTDDLVRQVLAELVLDPRPVEEWSPIKMLSVRLCENYRDCATYIYRALFVPRVADWAVVRLPKWLYPLYYALRPLRIGARWVKAVGLRTLQRSGLD